MALHDVNTPPQRGQLTAELGVVSRRRVGSTLYEDFIPQLRGRRAARVYEEMAWNDATIGGILYAVEQLVRQVEWTVESDDPAVLEFLTANIAGLQHSWDDFIAAALSELIYGWSMFETVYQRVEGQIWWQKFAFRSQDTLHEWLLDPQTGELHGFVQATRHGQTVIIPIQKLIHFRTTTNEGKPEGRSWLRRAYRAWYLKKRVEDIAAIGIERDLNGMPMAEMPIDILLAGEGDPEFDAIMKIVTGLKVDELQGIGWPLAYDENGNKLFELSLLSTSGRPKLDALQFIRTQAQDIAGVMLAQFVGLGRDAVGSRALAEPQQELFQTALGALLDSIEEQFHRQATQRLLDLNGMESGRIVHGELRDLDLEGIGSFLLRTAQAGATWFTDDPESDDNQDRMDELAQMAGLDPRESVIIEDENADRPRPATTEEP